MEFQVKFIVQGSQRCNSDYFLPLFRNNVFIYYPKLSYMYPLCCDYAHLCSLFQLYSQASLTEHVSSQPPKFMSSFLC